MLDPSATTLEFNAFDAQVIQDPYPYYGRLRQEQPAHWSPEMTSWVLSRHADVSAALGMPTLYSSAQGIFPSPTGLSMADAFLPMLIMTDPPRHALLRRAVSSAFTRKSIHALENTVRGLVRQLLDQMPWSGLSFDFVEAFSGPLPALVIADMMGIPRADLEQFRAWSTKLVQASSRSRDGLDAAAGLYEYFSGHVADRRKQPKDDLVSALVHTETDGERLTDAEVLGTCLLLLVAGHETTTNLLSNSMVVLAEHSPIREVLLDEPRKIPLAVEELLRYDSPVQGLSRTLTADVELHGERMSTGDTVLLLFGAANRDERAFSRPDQFDIGRGVERNLAFGRGIHFCLGAPLARLEARVALENLLPALGRWSIDRPNSARLASAPIRGFARLELAGG